VGKPAAAPEISPPALRRELGLRDLTLYTIACIISTRWLPAAAHAGPGSIVLWVLAAIFLVIPLAIAVAALLVKHPGSGGLYVWVRNEFGPWPAFLTLWVYWIGIAFWFPSAAIFYMSVGLGAAGGPAWSGNRVLLLSVSLAAIWVALGANLIGMKIGKWIENLGGASVWLLGLLLAAAAAIAWSARGPATAIHLAPQFNWSTVSFWSAIAYAMSGIELAGMIGDEIHDPARTFPRAAWIASAFIVLFYIAATLSLLTLLPPGQINEITGLEQAARAAAGVTATAWLAPLMILLVLASAVGQFGGFITSVSRLPFAAASDGLLPACFASVHPRWRTPHFSILIFGALSSFLLIAMQLGDTLRAAYQELVSLMVIAGFLAYVYLFAASWKCGKRLSAVAGLSITILAIVCAVVPTAEVTNVWLFEGKLAAGTLAIVGSAWWIYRRRRA
jgi:amino acid transporter